MGSRIPSHQLSNGLYISGRPEHHLKDRQPSIGARAVPYTDGDVKNSGELGKMFDIYLHDHLKPTSPSATATRPSSSSQHSSGSIRSGPNSGSGPIPKRPSSGPVVQLQPTGLITSGPLGSSVGRRSGQLEQSGSMGKTIYGSSVTTLGFDDLRLGFKVSKTVMWVLLVVAVMGLMVGAFVMVTVKKPVILVAVAAVLVPAVFLIMWEKRVREREEFERL